MKSNPIAKRWMAGLLLSALAVASLAPAAQARHGDGRRYKDYSYRSAPHGGHAQVRVVEIRRSSGSVPALAGFLGGLALGATIARAAEHDYCPPPAPAYYYYDPYCGERFASLEIYRSHLHHSRHPWIVRVIAVRSGDCLHTYHYGRDGWEDQDRGWHEDSGD